MMRRMRTDHTLQLLSPPRRTKTPRSVIGPGVSPEQVIAAWPASAPLAALTGGSTTHAPAIPGSGARWSILARPTDSARGYPSAIDAIANSIRPVQPPDDIPFTGGWIGWIAYEAGAHIEPTTRRPSPPKQESDWPDACFLRCPGAFVYDAQARQWWTVGDSQILPALDWEQADGALSGDAHACDVGPLVSSAGRDRYIRDAASVIELIHAGDAFQVNLAHHLSAPFRGDARRCFLDLIRSASPWFGAYIERPDGLGAICSLSPELFLKADLTTRAVSTRPIKGTRPDSSDEAELLGSAKDSAELAMIVDLMRNDLGRVCQFGSVRVTDPKTIERHASASPDRTTGVLHGVATIKGLLREDVGLRELLDATFPPGSVTGAPKVRAMQIINEFEPLPRGPYCGAIGFVSDSGSVELSVAIRTASILGHRPDPARLGVFDGRISFPVGAGLVADSQPEAEWRETLDKAAAFVVAMNGAMTTR